jgi:hypothetical protein
LQHDKLFNLKWEWKHEDFLRNFLIIGFCSNRHEEPFEKKMKAQKDVKQVVEKFRARCLPQSESQIFNEREKINSKRRENFTPNVKNEGNAV